MSQIYKNSSGGGGGGGVNTLTGDTGGAVSPDGSGNINVLGQPDINVAGNPGTNTLTWTDLTKITPYVVDGSETAGTQVAYSTIQSAVNAAQLAGSGIIYIRPGTYIENVTISQPNIYLVGMIGCDGNTALSVTGGEILPVTIQGNFTLNLLSAVSTPFVDFKNICFTATSGVVFSLTGNISLLESGFITFDNCQLIGGNGSTYIFSSDGFFNINLHQSQVYETVPNTLNFFTFGATPFLNLNIVNSYVRINSVNALSILTNSFMVFTLQNSLYTARLDISFGSQALSFKALQCVFSPAAASTSSPLINFGSSSGSVTANNCLILATSGSLADSTDTTTASFFRYNNCVWNNALSLGTNGRGEFSFCEIYGGSSAALTFNSAQNCTLQQCVLNSTNNPIIDGSGSGSLTLLNNTFVGNQQLGTGVITPNVTHLVQGTGQTIDVGTADLVTYTLRNVAAVYSFTALIAGISVAGSAAAFQLIGIVKTNGATATIVGTIDQIGNADLAIAGANVTGVVSGNNFIIRATGSLGAVINWDVDWTFKQITN